MPEAIKAALTSSLELATNDSNTECPKDIQYMPPGTHRIHASRAGKPVALDISVDAATADTLNDFLQAQLTKATAGNDDRPFFDFNHEDREAAAWPTEFYWAGDDPKTGGVRAKIEWSGAGQTAVKEKTFRRFSPTFIPDDQGKVIGSETNMGGLVNRAAFKTIAPLFAKGGTSSVSSAASESDSTQQPNTPTTESDSCPFVSIRGSKQTSESASMNIKSKLHALKLIDSVEASESDIVTAIETKFTELTSLNEQLTTQLAEMQSKQATTHVEAAVKAGRLAPKDEDAKAFWTEALLRDEAKAVKALEALPTHPVLAKVTDGDDPKHGLLDKMQLQQQKLAEVRAAHPQADFQTVFSKAQTEAPDLFR